MGRSTKSVTFQGLTYNSVKDLATKFGLHPSTVGRRIRDGWSLDQALGLISRRRSGRGKRVEFAGSIYPSLNALAIAFDIAPETFRARLYRGLTIEQALLGSKKHRSSPNAKPIMFRDQQYPSQQALAKEFKLSDHMVGRRLKRGWSIEQALGVEPPPPRFRNHQGHARSTKWKLTRNTKRGVEPVPDSDGYKIYKITNDVNNKIYIGLTTGKLESRLKQHFSASRKGIKAPLANAIRKYGEHAFRIELVRNDARSFDELQDQEIRAIADLDTIQQGYNVAIGGAVGITKPIIVANKFFPSRGQAAEFYGVGPSVFNLRIVRLRWSPEEAAGLVTRNWSGKRVKLDVKGKNFESIRQAAAAFGKDFRKVYDRFSQKKWTIEQALDLDPPPDSVKYTGKCISAFGIEYRSIAAAARAHGIHPETLRKLIVKGDEINDAIMMCKLRARRPRS